MGSSDPNHHKNGHHAPYHPLIMGAKTVVAHPTGTIAVTVPAHNETDANRVLQAIGSGGLGTGINNTYLGIALPGIRSNYYRALQGAESEIRARQASLGPRINNPIEYRQFVAWASGKRTSIARLYRIPSGTGAVIGGELRDNLKYGLGGRTPDNLVARNMERGLSEQEALAKVLSTVDKPNVAVTESVLKGAKYLKGGGAVLFVGGIALSGYEVYKADPKDRPALIKKEAVTTGTSMLATDLVVGVAFMLGATGIGLIAIGVVAGVAASYGAEKLYYAHQQSDALNTFTSAGSVHAGALQRTNGM
jgi:hypothetical protein